MSKVSLQPLITCTIYYLIHEAGDNNWMLVALGRTTFGSSEYYSGIRVKVRNYF